MVLSINNPDVTFEKFLDHELINTKYFKLSYSHILSILLIFFIITYNYEQFYEAVKTPVQLSEETHERVNAVIMSIIMAILVIMFYFKSGFNFDPKAGLLKILAKIWIFLNAVLIISAMIKNYDDKDRSQKEAKDFNVNININISKGLYIFKPFLSPILAVLWAFWAKWALPGSRRWSKIGPGVRKTIQDLIK